MTISTCSSGVNMLQSLDKHGVLLINWWFLLIARNETVFVFFVVVLNQSLNSH